MLELGWPTVEEGIKRLREVGTLEWFHYFLKMKKPSTEHILWEGPHQKQDQKQCAFTGDREQNIYVVLSQGYVNSLVLCSNVV